MVKPIVFAAALALIAVQGPQSPPYRTTTVHITQGIATYQRVTATHDGKRIYFVRDSAEVVLFDRSTGMETRIITLPVQAIRVSPRGDRLVLRRSEDGRTKNAWTLALDPATGLAAGSPARLSLTPIDYVPVFSPDGKTVTLTTDQKSLALAPAVGGPERVLLKSKGYFYPVQWAPDGKSLYVGISFDPETATDRSGIYRVSINGGTPELVARTAGWGASPGLTADGKSLMFWKPEWDSVIVQTLEGRRLASFVPPEEEGVPDYLRAGNRGIASVPFYPRALGIRQTNSDKTVTLADSLNSPGDASWSPDGRRIALVGSLPRHLTVTNADGSGRRIIPLPANINPARVPSWSPDGQRVLYRGGNGVLLVDITAGTVKDLVRSHSWGLPITPVWRSDSRAIVYATGDSIVGPDSTRTVTFREKTLEGDDRALRTIRLICPAACDAKIVNDTTAVFWRQNAYRSVSLRATSEPRLVYTRDGTGQPVPTFSANGQWMAVRVAVQGEQLPRRVDVMRIDGSQRTTVNLDLTTLSGGENPRVSDDGRTLFVLGAVTGGFEYRRFDVATGRSTTLASFRSDDRSGFSPTGLSPDGRSIVYHTALPRYTKFYEVDMSPLLSGVGTNARKNR